MKGETFRHLTYFLLNFDKSRLSLSFRVDKNSLLLIVQKLLILADSCGIIQKIWVNFCLFRQNCFSKMSSVSSKMGQQMFFFIFILGNFKQLEIRCETKTHYIFCLKWVTWKSAWDAFLFYYKNKQKRYMYTNFLGPPTQKKASLPPTYPIL